MLNACDLISNNLSGTYTLERSGLLGNIISAVGALESLTFSGDKVTVNVSGGVTWSGTYTVDGSDIKITPEDGGIGLSGKLSEDKKTITIATLKYVKE